VTHDRNHVFKWKQADICGCVWELYCLWTYQIRLEWTGLYTNTYTICHWSYTYNCRITCL